MATFSKNSACSVSAHALDLAPPRRGRGASQPAGHSGGPQLPWEADRLVQDAEHQAELPGF